jgi:hypothetical protein
LKIITETSSDRVTAATGNLRPVSFLLLLLSLCASALTAQTTALAVDVSATQGVVRHGATGWLYGLAAPGVPDESTIAPLTPGIAAQKAPGGLQHPAGDALLVAPSYRRAGGKEVQIYIQDIYPDWPYNKLGMDDYLAKIKTVAHEIESSGDAGFFVYVPFNEPDNNWYGYSGDALLRFLADWKAAYLAIRSIDSKARIAGPNFEHFKPDTYRQFLTFARDNHVLPDEVTWHELHNDFFTDWNARYAGYRAIESELGIAPLPVVINEYARQKGDLAVPGNLIQWIARFEASGVDACLAFWTPSGTLSDLVARTWSNRPTGAWWLYRWYGEMSGNRVKVLAPDANAIGLQGIASYDQSKKQARVLFGGSSGNIEVKIAGLASIPGFQSQVHVSLWQIASSGIEPTAGPQLLSDGNRSTTTGDLTVTVTNADPRSAYYAIVSPAFDDPAPERGTYLAAYATLSGNASPLYANGAASVGGNGRDGTVEFVVQTQEDGFYRLNLRYAPSATRRAGHITRTRVFALNGATLSLPVDAASKPNEVAVTAFLPGGINRIKFDIKPNAAISSLDVTQRSGEIAAYSAPVTTGDASLVFKNVVAPVRGAYDMIVTYANDDHAHGGQAEDFADFAANGSPSRRYYFKNTFDAQVFRTAVIPVDLRKGPNLIRFAHPSGGQMPHIAKIQIAAAVKP